MTDAPDFAALRAARDAALKELFEAACAEMGCDPAQAEMHVLGARGCYCACPDGPCEHVFTGWRRFADGGGGESYCQACGLGAMRHSLKCDW